MREAIDEWQALQSRVNDAQELVALEGESLLEELGGEVDSLEVLADSLEFRTMLSGKYDAEDAILAIHSGAGGVDAMDWTGMLQRMFLRWAEAHGFKASLLDQSQGEEAGLKSATVSISGDWA